MVIRCAIRSCNSKENNGVIMHVMPTDPYTFSDWENAICEFQPDFVPTTQSKICCNHFVKSDYYMSMVSNTRELKKNAVPSVFKPGVCKSLSNVDILDVYEDTVGNNFGHHLIVSAPEDEIKLENPTISNSFITPPISKKRKYYVDDFNKEDLNSPFFRHRFWLASKDTIKSQQRKIEYLENENYKLQQKIVNMDQLIEHLRSEKNIDRNFFSFHKEDTGVGMNHNNQIGVPSHLCDHDYLRLPNHMVEEEEEIDILGHVEDHGFVHQPFVLEIDNLREDEVPLAEEVMVEQSTTYKRHPGVQRKSTIYVDNVGYKYYKREALTNTISLVCERQKNHKYPRCFGTASINIDMADNRFTLRHLHNHQPDEGNLHVPLMTNATSKRRPDQTNTVASMKTIYNDENILHNEDEIDILVHLDDHNYIHQPFVLEIDKPRKGKVPLAEKVMVEQSKTYKRLPGIHRRSTIYVDNVGFKYYKREAFINTISLVCERQKNHKNPKCYGSATISIDLTDNQLIIRNSHNHQPD